MSTSSFGPGDLEQIREKGISMDLLETHLENFRKGFTPIELTAPATVQNGIIRLAEREAGHYASLYGERAGGLDKIKFVPASGAASRMFKSVLEYLNGKPPETPAPIAGILEGISRFAFREELAGKLEGRGMKLGDLIARRDIMPVLEGIVLEWGLDYGQLPKGLIRFHSYDGESRTPVEEHLVEGAEYCRNEDGTVNLHFTVSPEHLDRFIDLLNGVRPHYESRFGVRYKVEFSLQRSFTDTIAVDLKNQPFRQKDGSLLFRPGGHGALLANLNELDADLVFIKNIDNVCPDRMKPVTYLYKKALAGVLLEKQEKAFGYIARLDSGDKGVFGEIEAFLGESFNTRLGSTLEEADENRKMGILRKMLNRPVRVCGMVRNEGEPGGGPFWTRNRDGSESLQIVEQAQINADDPGQAQIASLATHFNPVDLVCAAKDYKGRSFDLQQFVDPQTGLISGKSYDGRELKAQELPGLWNGSMSDWNTIFVEVPIETFNPVKTINDLLRPEHQG